jgi:hypothetical protein
MQKENIQHSTFNIQHPMWGWGREGVGRWMWVPLFLLTACAWGQTSTNNALPALAPAYGEMKPVIFGKYEVPEFWAQHGVLIILTSLAVIVSAGVLIWLVVRPGPPVAVLPELMARAALVRLSHLPEDGKVLSEISQVLRRYIIESFRLPVVELTTGEFSGVLAGNEKIGPELAQAVVNFLRECDQRKFSPVSPESQLNAASRALELVSQAERRRMQYDTQTQAHQ